MDHPAVENIAKTSQLGVMEPYYPDRVANLASLRPSDVNHAAQHNPFIDIESTVTSACRDGRPDSAYAPTRDCKRRGCRETGISAAASCTWHNKTMAGILKHSTHLLTIDS